MLSLIGNKWIALSPRTSVIWVGLLKRVTIRAEAFCHLYNHTSWLWGRLNKACSNILGVSLNSHTPGLHLNTCYCRKVSIKLAIRHEPPLYNRILHVILARPGSIWINFVYICVSSRNQHRELSSASYASAVRAEDSQTRARGQHNFLNL